MPLTEVSVIADATSADNDGVVLVPNPLTVAIGGAAPANHFSLRFTMSTIVDTDTVVEAKISLKTSAAASAAGVDLWAAEFGAAVGIEDYNRAGSNVSPVQVFLDEIIPDLTASGVTLSLNIPSLYVNKLAATNSGFSDFEARPSAGYTPGIGNEAAVHGTGAAAEADKPVMKYTALTDTEIANGDTGTFRRLAIGAEAFLAFDVEATTGQAVKGEILLDIEGSGLDSYIENLSSRALSQNRIQPRKITPGRAGAGGDFSIEVTPEKCWKLLLGMFTVTTTGPVGSQYTHTFAVGQSDTIKTFTFIQKEGAFRFVYPGSMLSTLTLSARLDDIVMASFSVMARDEYFYDENAAGASDAYLLTSTSGYDSTANSLLSFAGVSVEFDGVADPGLVQDFSITFDQSVAERRGLANTRFVAGHYPGPVVSTINFTMYFENERQYKKFIGDNTQNFPTRASTCIEMQAMNLKLLGVCGTTDFEATIIIPAMVYNTIRKPVQGEDAVFLQCSAVAVMTGSTYVTVEVKNTEASYPDSTNNITVLPSGVTYPV